MCQPDNVYWCDGSEQEREQLTKIAVQCGDLLPLNQKEAPGCYLHRSALNDVARTENLTFVCTDQQEEAGPNNNWMAPAEAYDKLAQDFRRLDARADALRHSFSHGTGGIEF